MSTSAKRGFLVIADISGYTAYLSDSELEHATDVLKALLDLLIDHTKPPLALSGLEGDAVLSYSIDSDRFEGQAFIEMIEQTYVAFKRAIDLMVLNTSCKCNACANISTLDLKFFVHHGEFGFQELGGRQELIGTDVVLIHRLMKNSVVEATGFDAYALYTQSAIDRLALEGITEGLSAHEEVLPDIGTVQGWVADLTPIWESNKAKPGLDIAEDRVIRFVEEYPLSPEQVWGYLTNPEYRQIFSNAKRQVAHQKRNGRIGEGSVYECFHMDDSISTNTILEWQPFSRIVSRNTAARSSQFLCIIELDATEVGTRVTMKYGPLRGPLIDKVISLPRFLFTIKPRIREGMRDLRLVMEEDIAKGRVPIPESAEVTSDDVDTAITAALTNLHTE
jgi:uncharacterized protein YndB with AHSA1/START domain